MGHDLQLPVGLLFPRGGVRDHGGRCRLELVFLPQRQGQQRRHGHPLAGLLLRPPRAVRLWPRHALSRRLAGIRVLRADAPHRPPHFPGVPGQGDEGSAGAQRRPEGRHPGDEVLPLVLRQVPQVAHLLRLHERRRQRPLLLQGGARLLRAPGEVPRAGRPGQDGVRRAEDNVLPPRAPVHGRGGLPHAQAVARLRGRRRPPLVHGDGQCGGSLRCLPLLAPHMPDRRPGEVRRSARAAGAQVSDGPLGQEGPQRALHARD
mmetsp:Transcript_86267/g.279290  ORF Transcript_86267/g.279290 Transcript_86267/m.279290 type:complete len:261 (+) Transcript_86267:1507-2289(+)